MTSSRGEHTRAVHPPVPAPLQQHPVALPVHRSAAYAFTSAQEYADLLDGVVPGYSYGRIDGPTSDAFAAAVAALEGAGIDAEVVGQPFGSGMAAISTTLMALTSAGGHVVAPREIYGGTYDLLTRVLARFGVETSFVDLRDTDAVQAAFRPSTRVLWAETLANPTMTVADLPALSALAHDAGIVLAVDSTFASPAICRPLEHGVDLVVHSATKYLGGHSDATGGVVVGAPDLVAAVRRDRVALGGMLAADEAFLLHRGLATLPIRVERHCRSALAVAQALQEHPGVERVEHPGLAAHPEHGLAVKLFDEGRYGGVVCLTPRGGRAQGMALCDALQLVEVATSLGGHRSKISHVASTTHRQLTPDDLAAAGIGASTVRLSVGLEDSDDIIDDLVQALDAR